MKQLAAALLFLFCLAQGSLAKAYAPAQTNPEHHVGYVILEGVIDEELVKHVSADMITELANGSDQILLRINSPGGSIPDGFVLSRLIEEFPAPVVCVVDGEAASMAMYILQSCDTRIMTKRSLLMAHEPALSGVMSGRPNDWAAIADYMKKLTYTICQHVTARMKCSPEFMMNKIEGGKQWWFTWKDAKRWGAVDLVVKSALDVENAMSSGKPFKSIAQ